MASWGFWCAYVSGTVPGGINPTFTTVGIGSDRGCLAGSDAETHAFQPGQAMDGRLSNSSGLRGIATLHC